ncbi:hypothetical protein Back11_34650 [Paenibacillus baekrokdamisoli]|uniref:Uncharacterized protein n=1 Tax=Paenibacillus baekrokdamisoli TaxID=1712516 RepID=A0A3G9ITB8_9BACL|nr:response regulator [Paenibacillus baekrokdamisoli]MBB3070941.1 two-component system response regulator YesN [Paenibacillus baekrokdamisoli]BBH22120.1 hypothetical protein Back11_34650 [Paenibacillus baekrokdamisoli]
MRIMIVDDEPFYIDHLKEVIENSRFSKSAEVHIAAECISASLAIKTIPIVQPDLIFTDIRMQFMNGIELAATIQETWPHIIVVIVSGYSSFDYARDALRANVDDYLVKPIDPDVIEQVLDKASARINKQAYLRQQHYLKGLLDNEPMGIDFLTSSMPSFSFPSYIMIFFKKKTALLEKEKPLPQTEYEIQNQLSQHHLLLKNEKVRLLPIKDQKNGVIILGLYECDDQKIKDIASECQLIIGYDGSAPSIAASGSFHELTQIHPIANQLHDELYHQLVIGHTKQIYLFEQLPAQEKSNLLLDSTDEKKVVIAVEKKDWKLLKKLIDHWFYQWEQHSCPSLYVQRNIKKILQWLEKHFRSLDPLLSITTEKEMEEMIDSARSFRGAAETFWNLLSHTFQFEEQESTSNRGIRLIEQITDYLTANLSEPIAMTNVMDRFQISSTHLGTLFRKHLGKTFVEYLTTLRIDKAKELMRIHPDMAFKEISEITGYSDRHYFTKVFKLVTGKSPTDFKEQLLQEEN